MNFKKRQSMMLGIAVAFLMISVGFFTGCTSNNHTNSVVMYPVLSSVDSNILKNAYADYEVLRQNVSAQEARQQLLDTLNNETEGVEVASLGIDGYTIFITYRDDDFAAVDTFELDEEPVHTTTGFNALTYGESSDNDYLARHSISFDGFSNNNHYTSEKRYGAINEIYYDANDGESQKKTTCGSKNVLVLGPCYWEFPTTPTDDCVQLFKSHGWTNDDITLKLVTISPQESNTDCMNLQPNDYFKLGKYGIILFIGHGTVSVYNGYNETNLYLQFCYLTNESFVTNPQLQTWKDQKQLIILNEYTTNSGGSVQYIYSTAIRADLLRQQIKETLSSSFIYFSTCYGSYFNQIFLDKSAKIFFSWDNSVIASYADANMKSIVQSMLENGTCTYDAYANGAVVKAYRSWDPTDPIRGLVPVETNQDNWRPNVNFLMYPKPDENSISHLFYFPAWFDKITITGIPDDTQFINVTLLDSAENRVKWKRFSVNSPSLSITDLNDILFRANETPTIQVTALDNTGNELATLQTTGVISAGANPKQINLTGYEDKTRVEYTYGSSYSYKITINLTASSNEWETGKEITATAICTLEPIGDGPHVGVPGFQITLQGASGEVVSYAPSIAVGENFGQSYNGRVPGVEWGAPPVEGWWGSPAIFTATFRLESKVNDHPCILAQCMWSTWGETDWAKIYIR